VVPRPPLYTRIKGAPLVEIMSHCFLNKEPLGECPLPFNLKNSLVEYLEGNESKGFSFVAYVFGLNIAED
jgi:hypothetical protein